jgi:hypothetical protein
LADVVEVGVGALGGCWVVKTQCRAVAARVAECLTMFVSVRAVLKRNVQWWKVC